MIRCSSCKQTHWVYAKAGKPGLFEWLTGLTPYRCLACRRRGWHRSHRISPAFEALSRVMPLRSRETRGFAAAVLGDRRAPAVLAGAIVLGIGTGAAVLLSGGSTGVDSQTTVVTPQPAPPTLTKIAADELTASPGLAGGGRAAAPAGGPTATPTAGDGQPAATSTAGDVRPTAAAAPRAAPPVAPASRVAPPVAPARTITASKTATPEPRDRKPARATAPPVRQPSPATARTAAARPRTRPAPALPKFHGTLAVRSEPRGALVSVDGRVVGSTPLRLKAVPAGSRIVRIESEGYERWSSAARVVANQETSIVATLQRGSSQ